MKMRVFFKEPKKLIPRLTWKIKGLSIVRTILEEQTLGAHVLLEIKTSYQVIITKMKLL